MGKIHGKASCQVVKINNHYINKTKIKIKVNYELYKMYNGPLLTFWPPGPPLLAKLTVT